MGGWSDQLAWDGPAAVLNFACGWDDGSGDPYPLRLTPTGTSAGKTGRFGTGLGVSSIVEAGRYLQDFPGEVGFGRASDDPNLGYEMGGGYTPHVLAWEREHGAGGGWQDAIGGIEPGLKLIETTDHRTFRITRRDTHPLLDHLVLFDTGLRRNSGEIGDEVRKAMQSRGRAFETWMQMAVAGAHEGLSADAERCAELSIGRWDLLRRLFPQMHVDVPYSDLAWGHKLAGAGGGGYGIYFVKEPASRQTVIDWLGERGLWAAIPVLLPGAQWAEEEARAAA